MGFAMDELRFDREIEVIRKLDKDGDERSAIEPCRSLLATLPSWSQLDKVIIVRKLFIISLAFDSKSDDEIDELEMQYNLLFENHLTIRDRLAAANTLLEKAESFRDYRCWDALTKVIDLFSTNRDLDIINAVLAAYDRKVEICVDADQDFMPLLIEYGKFLERPEISIEKALSTLSDFDELTNSIDEAKILIKIAESFTSARGSEIGGRLNELFARNYAYVGDHREAILYCWYLIIDEEESRSDYLLWMGESFRALDLNNNAQMCLYEVMRMLGSDSEDGRAKKARELLAEIVAEEKEHPQSCSRVHRGPLERLRHH
jgi:hypothetical protein